MNMRSIIILVVILLTLTILAVQAYALPQYFDWGSMSVMGSRNGHMNQGNGCDIMNGQGMMRIVMNGQFMNSQRFQQQAGPNGNQMVGSMHHQQQCPYHGTTT